MTSFVLLVAAILTFAIGLVHSYLGEKYILIRLFRQPLPKLFGDDHFTKQTLRFAWHLTSIAWFGIGVLLMLLYLGYTSRSSLLNVIGTTFAVSALTALLASRGKHLSWVAFGAVAIICYVSASVA